MQQWQEIQESVKFLQQKIEKIPEALLILGSGLGDFAEGLANPQKIPYQEIPHFLTSSVAGHANQLVLGHLAERYVAVMQGRFHHYEGYGLAEITLPIKVFAKLGTKVLLVTNAAGIINLNFRPGSLMLITDHLNLLGDNPLIGRNEEKLGPRFPDMTEVYTKTLQKIALQAAETIKVPLERGIYAAMSGPSYETPAEIRMLQRLGADAVGMSTVPEAIVAKYCGMCVLGISCLTNYGAGLSGQKMNHQEVLANAEKVKEDFSRLIEEIIVTLPQEEDRKLV